MRGKLHTSAQVANCRAERSDIIPFGFPSRVEVEFQCYVRYTLSRDFPPTFRLSTWKKKVKVQVDNENHKGRTRRRRGQTLVEYAMILVVVVVVCVVALTKIGDETDRLMPTISNALAEESGE